MDPNANLTEQLELARQLLDPKDLPHELEAGAGYFGWYGGTEGFRYSAERLAEFVLALDSHLRSGGYFPDAWTDNQKVGKLVTACQAVAAYADCQDAADWKDAFGELTSKCREALELEE